MQLGSRDAMPDLAVKDLGRARKFYEGVLGLKKLEEGVQVVDDGPGIPEHLRAARGPRTAS